MQLEVAVRHPASGLVACDGGRFSGGGAVPGHLLSHWVIDRLAERGPGELSGRFYRESLRNDAEDWDYTLRIALGYPITMHRHPLVRYRVHDASRSGSQGRRQFVWAVWDLRVLTRHAALCPPEERAFVRRTKRDTVRAYAYEAYCYARRHDARVARRFLWWLLRQAPAEPTVAGALLGSWIPEGALGRVLGAARQAGAALRRARRRRR